MTGINRLLDIELSDGRKLSKVPTSALAAVNPYHEGQIVIQGECAGRIEEVKQHLQKSLFPFPVCIAKSAVHLSSSHFGTDLMKLLMLLFDEAFVSTGQKHVCRI